MTDYGFAIMKLRNQLFALKQEQDARPPCNCQPPREPVDLLRDFTSDEDDYDEDLDQGANYISPPSSPPSNLRYRRRDDDDDDDDNGSTTHYLRPGRALAY